MDSGATFSTLNPNISPRIAMIWRGNNLQIFSFEKMDKNNTYFMWLWGLHELIHIEKSVLQRMGTGHELTFVVYSAATYWILSMCRPSIMFSDSKRLNEWPLAHNLSNFFYSTFSSSLLNKASYDTSCKILNILYLILPF